MAAAAQAQRRERREWKPRLGVLGQYTPANLQFLKEQGFGNMIFEGTPGSTMNPGKLNDSQIEAIKTNIQQSGLTVSAFQSTANHIDPDPAKRAQANDYFVKLIGLAGKLGIPYIGTTSGKDPDPRKPLKEQVDEIVRVYTEKYFPACQANNVKILWEPWPGGPNLATSPVGFEALFTAFGSAPYVGLQYDPSHLLWQMMDPIQTARDFVDKIYDVHLKDTEIRWPILRKGGITPVDHASWWRYRLPGLGSVDWPAFFTVLQDAGYQGAMSLEHEDPLYGAPNRGGPEFTAEFKTGLIMGKRYLQQYVP